MALAADIGTVTDDCVRLTGRLPPAPTLWVCWSKATRSPSWSRKSNGWLNDTYTDSEGTHTGYVSGEFVKTNAAKKTDSKKTTSKDTETTTKAKADTTRKAAKTEKQTTKKVKKQQAAADTSAVSLGAGHRHQRW